MYRKAIVLILILKAIYGFTQEDNYTGTAKISLLFIGDIMQHDSQIASAYDTVYGQYNYKPCLQFVKSIIEGTDIAIANLEITFGGAPYSGYPQFSAPDALAGALKNAGIDYLVTANNHSYDRGKKGCERTINLLDSLNFEHTGTFKDSIDRTNRTPLVIRKNGFKFALLNYTYGTNGIVVSKPNIVNYIDTSIIRRDLILARDSFPDAIIVFMHWGTEYERQQNSKQKELAGFCMKNGATLIIGSHPHVVQPMERFIYEGRDALVVYSLGNYISSQRKRYTDGGVMLRVDMRKSNEGDVWIDNAGYYLTWVYVAKRGQGSEFNILPVSLFERDTIFMDGEGRNKMKLFANDSRILFKSLNKGVSEYVYEPSSGVWENNKNDFTEVAGCMYKIQLFASKDRLKDFAVPWLIDGYLYTIEENGNGIFRYMYGCFTDYGKASESLKGLMDNTPYKDAFIVKYINGQREIKNAD